MQIEELINLFRINDTAKQNSLNLETEKSLKELAKTHQGWKLFCHMLEMGDTGYYEDHQVKTYDPDNMLSLCNKLNIKTDIKLYEFVDALKYKPVIDIINPEFKLYKTEAIKAQEIYDFIIKNAPQENNVDIVSNKDDVYQLIHEDEIDYMIKKCPINKLKYISTVRDCDDFAFMTKSWYATKGYGNITLPYVEVNCYYNGKYDFAHAINIIVFRNRDGDVDGKFFEPQNDKTWGFDSKMWMGLKPYDIKIRQILL